jgi:hypothetical protein
MRLCADFDTPDVDVEFPLRHGTTIPQKTRELGFGWIIFEPNDLRVGQANIFERGERRDVYVVSRVVLRCLK